MEKDQRDELQDELDQLDPMLRVEFLTTAKKRETALRLDHLEALGKINEGKSLFGETKELFEYPDDEDPLSDSRVAYWVNSEYIQDLYHFKSLTSKWEDK